MAGATSTAGYVRAQALALLGNASPQVAAVSGAAVLGYAAGWWGAERLALAPAQLARPWPALLAWALEPHAWALLAHVAAVALCAKLVEPLWGRRETLAFFALANLGVALLAAAYYLLLYTCTRNPDYLFDVRIRGLSGYIAALAVAVKQVMPDHLLVSTAAGKITNRVIPLLVFIAALCLWALGGLEGTYPVMWACGTIVSWMYLRFWQRHSNGTRGDAAENFGFDNFFPTVLQPFIRAVLLPFEKCFVKIGLCPASRRRVHLALSPGGLTISLPGVEPQDMERRRQIALKALSERLSKTSDQAHRKSKGNSQVPSFQNPNVVIPLHSETVGSSSSYYSGKSREFKENVSPPPVKETTLINIDAPAMPALNQQAFGNS